MKSQNKKSPDLVFLEKRLLELVKDEEYEKAEVIKRWIDELSQKQQVISSNCI